MPADGYRLWQAWQQMHYPVRGLPVTDSARSDFAGLDGVVVAKPPVEFGHDDRWAALLLPGAA